MPIILNPDHSPENKKVAPLEEQHKTDHTQSVVHNKLFGETPSHISKTIKAPKPAPSSVKYPDLGLKMDKEKVAPLKDAHLVKQIIAENPTWAAGIEGWKNKFSLSEQAWALQVFNICENSSEVDLKQLSPEEKKILSEMLYSFSEAIQKNLEAIKESKKNIQEDFRIPQFDKIPKQPLIKASKKAPELPRLPKKAVIVHKEVTKEKKEVSPFEQTKANRSHPPISIVDEIHIVNGKIVSRYDRSKNFLTHVKMHPFERIVPLENGSSVKVGYTRNGKAVIQQQAVRGCSAAVAAMLIVDNGGKYDEKDLILRNLGSQVTIGAEIRAVGLSEVQIVVNSLSDLQSEIQRNGSAVVGVRASFGGHFIIVDHLTAAEARIRDPWHGWEVTIPINELSTIFEKGQTITQVRK